DRVLEIDPGKRILALKNISCNEPFFQGHWPERPVMPGVLIVEALAQAAGLMISDRAVHDGRMAVIASLDHVKIRRPVVPGDQLVLEAKGLKLRSRLADVRGVARVEGQVVAEATIRFMLIEAERAA
ncbi:MAG: 3-hydroxyacyl-ACP dehydratase FabZ, partial [Planctomycetota bacterium]|nr:3-hydroxyacyl-ACP dehydratase FabZ [Planctomycetota bacterium]